ncbi:MAG: NAD(P)H-binding protein, partial [Endomicrobia bacterium]|nr:NAD(P)H-binding protein [Endomicrobiia bacterium]
MRIMIFGGSGFLGKNIVKNLSNSHEIYIPTRKIKHKYNENNINFLPFNIEENISQIKPQLIINLIGILKESKDTNYEKAHIENIEKIIHSMLKNKVNRLIHISALGVGRGCESRYFKTKEKTEELIKNSGLNYLIIRPPIMIGDGQKLNEELKIISKISPVIFAPKSKVSFCNVEEVVNVIINNLNHIEGTIEIKGKTVKYKKLFEVILNSMKIKRLIIELPVYLFLPIVILSFILKKSILTYDTY